MNMVVRASLPQFASFVVMLIKDISLLNVKSLRHLILELKGKQLRTLKGV